MDDLLTVQETAAKVGVTVGRVRQLLGEGRFQGAFKRGGAWWVPVASVDAFIATDRDRRLGNGAKTEVPGEQQAVNL